MDVEVKPQAEYKDLVGLEYGGEQTVECATCDKPLIVVMKVKDAPMVIQDGTRKVEVNNYKFVSNCPFCGGKSWIVKVTGTVFVANVPDKTILININMDQPQEDMVIEVEVMQCKMK